MKQSASVCHLAELQESRRNLDSMETTAFKTNKKMEGMFKCVKIINLAIYKHTENFVVNKRHQN